MKSSTFRTIASSICALGLVVATGCGSDSANTGSTDSTGSTGGTGGTGAASVPGTSYSGVLQDGSVVTLTFGQAAALVLDRAATTTSVAVTGTLIAANGTTYSVTGSYDPSTGAFQVTAGPYSLSGTYTNGAFKGSYTGPNGSSGTLGAVSGTSVTRYCGTYAGSKAGAFNIVVAGQKAFVAAKDIVGEGTVSGSSVSFSIPATASTPTITITGQLSGTSASGTWTATDSSGTGTGTWSGDSTKCAVASSSGTQCNPVGTWTLTATTNQQASPTGSLCTQILQTVVTLGQPGTATVSITGTSITADPGDGSLVNGTFDAGTCKATLTDNISKTLTVNGTSVALTGTQRNDITFSSSSLTNLWTVTVNTVNGSSSGLPCTITASQTGTK